MSSGRAAALQLGRMPPDPAPRPLSRRALGPRVGADDPASSGSGVRRIAFTETGQLVSAGTDGTVRWWWLDVEPLRQAVEQLDIGGLTEAERDRVGHLLDD